MKLQPSKIIPDGLILKEAWKKIGQFCLKMSVLGGPNILNESVKIKIEGIGYFQLKIVAVEIVTPSCSDDGESSESQHPQLSLVPPPQSEEPQ